MGKSARIPAIGHRTINKQEPQKNSKMWDIQIKNSIDTTALLLVLESMLRCDTNAISSRNFGIIS